MPRRASHQNFGYRTPDRKSKICVTNATEDAPDLQRLGVIDGIVPEPVGGAHRNWEETAAAPARRSATISGS
jgi:acetyl-CoA carboxylase alpha subunit